MNQEGLDDTAVYIQVKNVDMHCDQALRRPSSGFHFVEQRLFRSSVHQESATVYNELIIYLRLPFF